MTYVIFLYGSFGFFCLKKKMDRIQPIEWKEDYALGSKFIDDNHRKLVDTVNLLANCLNDENEMTENFFSIYHRLAFYAESHFVEEEKFFAKNNCPNMEEHKKSHVEFIDKLVEYQKLYQEKGNDIYPDIFQFLKTWLEKHILIYDKCIIQNVKLPN